MLLLFLSSPPKQNNKLNKAKTMSYLAWENMRELLNRDNNKILGIKKTEETI